MSKPLALLLALAVGLLVCFVLVLAGAYRSGISVQLGESLHLTPPPAPPRPAAGAAYSNEELHELLQRQTSALGIQGVGKNSDPAEEDTSFLGPRLGAPGTRAQAEASIRQLRRLQRAVDSGKHRPVPLAGKTVSLLAEPEDRSVGEPAQDGWAGPFGGSREGCFTVSDRAEWAALWSDCCAGPVPAVDFSRWRVAAVFLGRRPTGGYRVKIDARPETGASDVAVRYREIAPEPGRTPPEGATAPYAMTLLPRSELPIRFQKRP
ncbi:MAG: protease complex subunit PrcB family protein [Elusimicrobia bacterium]|nr:protease complex subunit PrcB family protein [Elusimicrobiota bacterium]